MSHPGRWGMPAFMLVIASWNINSVRLRKHQVAAFLEAWRPDVLCLQEIRCATESFPAATFRKLGYGHMAVRGRKNHHGVAIVSRRPISFEDAHVFCGLDDARHVMAVIDGVRIHSLYVPAGGDVPDAGVNPKFAHKLAFLEEMRHWLRAEARQGAPVVLTGDLNVAPLEDDVWDHARMRRVITHTEVEREALMKVLRESGLHDVVRAHLPPPRKVFTWWSYRAGADWRRHDRGRRLDHVWATADLLMRAREVAIAKETRSWPRPSDHVPVLARFDI